MARRVIGIADDLLDTQAIESGYSALSRIHDSRSNCAPVWTYRSEVVVKEAAQVIPAMFVDR